MSNRKPNPLEETESRPPRHTKEPSSSWSASSWSAGIVNHGSYDDLHDCLASLTTQTPPPARTVVYDTGQFPERAHEIARWHPDVEIISGPNCGYAGGANRILEEIQRGGAAAEFILILNPDVQLDSCYAEGLTRGMQRNSRTAIGGGKLLRPDRTTIDSAGITLPRHRRPRDRGSELDAEGRYNETEFVDAVSGAALMLRAAALENLSLEGEVFDEDFFVFYEDTDLCWRARRLGWQILFEPTATAQHGRGWQRGQRFEIAIATRRHSFKNHYLQIIKNETISGLLINLPFLAVWELIRIGFVLVRDRALLPAYADAWRALPTAFRRRRILEFRTKRTPQS